MPKRIDFSGNLREKKNNKKDNKDQYYDEANNDDYGLSIPPLQVREENRRHAQEMIEGNYKKIKPGPAMDC